MNIKVLLDKLTKKVQVNFFCKSYEQKRKYLIKQGAEIGENTRIISGIKAFGSEPYLIEVGRDCLFSSEVQLLTHDGGISVLNNLGYFTERVDKLNKVIIGDNVFIGTRVIVMPGVSIGNNVIIGAGSIVTKSIESNSVVCGVPAKKIMDINDYYGKCKGDVHYTTKMNVSEKRIYCNRLNNEYFKRK
ncbi:acyltransferase [Bacillus sp. NTK071]|uniref:acyltransferase n=1 Tax=Bacillus sp. NTK071 TaxID=2802175 RepID=UPI001A8E4B9F|nr:acyltransferase [Bacillus sp. NTK071]MBN8210240.1 acyltransferase [Bacillus sp. NTK071]